MNSFFGWVGGKKLLRDAILTRFPLHYDRYIEVFGGAAWVLFHKEPEPFEVYNDYNGNLTTLFQCVRERPHELIEALHYTLNSRIDFYRMMALFEEGAEMDDLQRAAYYFQLIRYSYGASVDSFGCKPRNIWNDFPHIVEAHRRLQNVVIENKDFASLLKIYDKPGGFCYCDPPYYGSENQYQMKFTKEDHVRLHDTLMNIEGKFLLSYNDNEFISELYRGPNIHIEKLTRLDNLKQRYGGHEIYNELLIANYDMGAKAAQHPQQLDLFRMEENEKCKL